MLKKEVRNMMIQRLKQNHHLDLSVYHKLYSTDGWINAEVIAVTLSTNLEINTQPIIEQAFSEGKQIVVPKTYTNHKMKFVLLSSDVSLKKNKFGILEPTNGKIIQSALIDLFIVPGLAFSLDFGDRVGFGGGYYDRYLKNYDGEKIAIAKTFQVFDKPIWHPGKFDIKVNKIIF